MNFTCLVSNTTVAGLRKVSLFTVAAGGVLIKVPEVPVKQVLLMDEANARSVQKLWPRASHPQYEKPLRDFLELSVVVLSEVMSLRDMLGYGGIGYARDGLTFRTTGLMPGYTHNDVDRYVASLLDLHPTIKHLFNPVVWFNREHADDNTYGLEWADGLPEHERLAIWAGLETATDIEDLVGSTDDQQEDEDERHED